MASIEEPKESNLELVISLSDSDVEIIDQSLLHQISDAWLPSLDVVKKAYVSLQSNYPTTPQAFYSYRLRKLVASNLVQANAPTTRDLTYQVRVNV